MSLTKVGIFLGIVISTASAAENANWDFFEAFAKDLKSAAYEAPASSPPPRQIHATSYSEHSIGVTWWPDKIVTFCPKLRFDHSYDSTAFEKGARRNQLVGSMDFIIHY